MAKATQQKNEPSLLASAWIVLGVCARLLPHPANVTPLTSTALFGGAELSRGRSLAILMVTLVLSDILLATAFGYPAFGTWTLFTYTGFAAISLAGGFLRGKTTTARTIGFLLGSSLFFWLWTNFGVWAVGGEGALYPRNLGGLEACYVAALPFLRNAMLGDLAWGFVFFAGFAYAKNLAPRLGFKAA